MNLLRTTYHPDVNSTNPSRLHRIAARGIILNGSNILLMYTERYHDYSLPGGGVDDGEHIIEGLIREIEEETGARNIQVLDPYGTYEEYRPWYKPEHDVLHMVSHCYLCSADEELGETSHEDYEQANGMVPVWISIHDAISHNREVMANSDKKGLSIERETWLLEKIASDFCS
ncbi:NUDIX hydrolase [Parendozoicomonas sp. Alg238-R29]|uniref:NUDIX hydrolase n=1 Tax=Parendozoicomonas sp. Alg238-R29 TaxID=2993446 RepID=UPI00248DD76C|nr:NUDIX hydrolase [Parendozoicomonas sp. Alg238-R29]